MHEYIGHVRKDTFHKSNTAETSATRGKLLRCVPAFFCCFGLFFTTKATRYCWHLFSCRLRYTDANYTECCTHCLSYTFRPQNIECHVSHVCSVGVRVHRCYRHMLCVLSLLRCPILRVHVTIESIYLHIPHVSSWPQRMQWGFSSL